MALNNTPAERQRAAAEDLAKKLRLEARADREFRELFRIMARDQLVQQLREFGLPISQLNDDARRTLLSAQNSVGGLPELNAVNDPSS